MHLFDHCKLSNHTSFLTTHLVMQGRAQHDKPHKAVLCLMPVIRSGAVNGKHMKSKVIQHSGILNGAAVVNFKRLRRVVGLEASARIEHA